MKQSSPDCQARVQQPADKHKRKRYECQIEGCNKKFSQKTHRDTHVRSHTGDRPYVCPIPGCGGRFTQAGNLKVRFSPTVATVPTKSDQVLDTQTSSHRRETLPLRGMRQGFCATWRCQGTHEDTSWHKGIPLQTRQLPQAVYSKGKPQGENFVVIAYLVRHETDSLA